MQFFNIRAQVVSLVLPDSGEAAQLDFRQATDAMKMELRITPPGSGLTAVLTFDKAGGLTGIEWQGKAAPNDPDAAQLDQGQADGMSLKPGQKAVDSSGRLVQAPGKDPMDAPFTEPVLPQSAVQGNGAGLAGNDGSAQPGAVNTTETLKPPRKPTATDQLGS